LETSETEETDEALVNRCRSHRDEMAFEELIHRHQDRIFRLAISILGPAFASEAEDVVQEVFLRVHTSLASFRGDSKFSSWIYRIAFNQALSWKSRVRFRKRHLDDESLVNVVTAEGNPVAAALNRQRNAALDECMGRLPDVYQSALRLHYWLGTSVKEIAELLRVPENSIKSYLYRARMLLAAMLRERGFSDE